jgi:hypothetical protein
MFATSVAFAQPKSESVALLGAQPLVTAVAPKGFVDDVVAVEGDRVAYVIADGTNAAALHIAQVGKSAAEEQIVDISTITLQPTVLAFVGQRIFVAGMTDGNKQVAGLVELSSKDKRKPAGSTLYRVAAADHIGLIVRDGKQRIAVHRQADKTGATTHTVELLAVENGRRVAQGKPLVVDVSGHDKKLDFRVNHWSDGWTKAYGVKAGEWDKKEDQKAPDQEATLDLVTGKIVRKKVEDLFEQKRRFAALADAQGKLDFLRMPPNAAAIELWRAGKMSTLTLDQKLTDYDPKSMQGVVNADGSGWLALKVDPVNAEAVARKRADPEYLDVFKIAADGKAVRKARVLAKGVRHRFGAAPKQETPAASGGGGNDQQFWLIERNAGFERGGKKLTLYQLQ